jgi:hypothetical protein
LYYILLINFASKILFWVKYLINIIRFWTHFIWKIMPSHIWRGFIIIYIRYYEILQDTITNKAHFKYKHLMSFFIWWYCQCPSKNRSKNYFIKWPFIEKYYFVAKFRVIGAKLVLPKAWSWIFRKILNSTVNRFFPINLSYLKYWILNLENTESEAPYLLWLAFCGSFMCAAPFLKLPQRARYKKRFYGQNPGL